MPGQLLPLRLFHAAAFSRTLFPNHLFLSTPRHVPTARLFSSRAAASSAGRPSFRSRAVSVSKGSTGSKSLIEDEAELSDWVSDLRTDSLRFSTDDDDHDADVDLHAGSRAISSSTRDPMKRRREDSRSVSRKSQLDGSRKFKDRPFDMSIPEQGRRQRNNGLDSRKSHFGTKTRLARNADEEDEDDSRKSHFGSKNRLARNADEEDEDDDEEDELFTRKSRSSLARNGRKDFGRKFNNLPGKKPRRSVAEMSEEGEGFDNDKEENDDDEDDLFEDKVDMKRGDETKNAFENCTDVMTGRDGAQPVALGSRWHDDSYLSRTRFDECPISPLSLKGIKAAGYERMTVVQEATLPVILNGKDVLAKAKTGTGKTVAFLLPAIEVVAKLPPVDRDQKRPPINVLVVCPTRELATQASSEAEMLLKYHPTIGVQVVIGGTRLALEQKRMQTNPCQILVATPGRLRDHLENTPGFATRLMGVKVLVLDEADRLLDMGFRKDIEKIVAAVPKQRQTLLFSATVPDEVRQICFIAMKRDHEFINTVEEGSEETHKQVRQMHFVAPLEKHFSILYGLLRDHIAEDVDYKVIVFCTTAMVTKLVADLLAELKLNVREIHSRKPQSYRTRVSKEFKESKGLILVSSDVSARGVDYPDVTLVIQVGVPADREQYIHRLGRTGRKGKEGKGILLLAPWEEFFLSSVKDLPISKASPPLIDPDTRKEVERALAHVELRNKESAYQAWLGYYNSNKNIDKFKLVSISNEFSRSMGLDTPPAIPKLVLRKMGLSNVPGLRAK